MKTLILKNGNFVKQTEKLKNGSEIYRWQALNGEAATVQRLKHRLKLYAGEWFLNRDAGVDWINLFEKPISVKRIKSELKKELELDPDVNSVISVELIPDYKTRILNISFSVMINDKKIEISEVIK